jgi:hypothetical protein
LLTLFLIPGGTLLETMQISERIPASLSQHWWWEAFVMAHQVWALLILSVLLVRQMWVKYIFHPVSDKVVASGAIWTTHWVLLSMRSFAMPEKRLHSG